LLKVQFIIFHIFLMNRRELLQKLAISAPGAFFLPTLLSSCFNIDEELLRVNNPNFRVAIVGAGAAGLYAGLLLERLGVNYTIYEASDRIGGRIKSVSGLAPYPIEMGANRLFGSNTLAADFYRTGESKFLKPENVVQSFDYKTEVRRRPDIVSDPEFSQIRTFVEDVLDYEGPSVSVLGLFTERAVPTEFRDLTESIFVSQFGGNMSQLNAAEIGSQQRGKVANDDKLELDGNSLISIFENQAPEVISKIVFNKQIRLINYGGDQIVMTPVSGEEITADYMIITSSINVLKSTQMVFRPLLSSDYSSALQQMQMSNAYTIALRFNRRFWTTDTKEIFTQGLVPYFVIPEKSRESGQQILVGQAYGAKADFLASLGNNAANRVVQDLDAIFKTNIPSSSFVGSSVENWTGNSYIRGGYSMPVSDAQRLREQLSLPINDKLFLAGEAINTNGHAGTIHGALESSFSAVNKLLEIAEPKI
jgi:monoamine oxidase